MVTTTNTALNLTDEAESRGQRLWKRMLEARSTGKLSLSRAKLVLASYRESEGLHPAIRKGRAFEKIVTGMPIHIEEDDLLVGDFAAKSMYFEWYPEYAVDQEMLKQPSASMLADGDTLDEMMEITGYFSERCLLHSYLSRISERERKIIAESGEDGAMAYRVKSVLSFDPGYHTLDHKKAVNKGFLGMIAEAEKELQATPIKDDESSQKANFLRGMIIALRAGIEYARRYAVLSRHLAKTAEGSRKAELERLADICEWVPANPARNFYEAVQASWFLHVLNHLETRAQESLGRMDQYFYPYYKRDIEEGRLTREEAIEILECLRVKMTTLRLFHNVLLTEVLSGEAQYHNVTLGGQTPEGEDATNELSYLFLEAAFRTRTPHPTLSIRLHKKISRGFFLKGLELVRLGLGYPAFFNDDSAIPWVMGLGAPLELARDYCISGCVHHTIAGQSAPFVALFVNIPKCLELALHDGTDPRTGKQIGAKTGSFIDFKGFDEVVNSFKTQVKYISEQGGEIFREQRVIRAELTPNVFASAFVDDCIRRGKNSMGGGARYELPVQIAVGMIDAADSMAAIKKCVFEEGSIGKQELLDALAVNFEGKEDLRQLLLSAPKYGNDDDYVDSIAADLYRWWQRMVAEIEAPYGAKYMAAPYSISSHGPYGKVVGALPSGRLAKMTLADGSVSPCSGMDTEGPTAVINSAGKIDQPPLFATLLNMKFHPSALKTGEDLNKLQALVKTYFDYGGKHMQFNVIDSKTLRDAQAHPELHRNLIVRVAGYSALFTELSRNIQDEIINRNTALAL